MTASGDRRHSLGRGRADRAGESGTEKEAVELEEMMIV